MELLLNVSGLTMDFGGIRALDHLDLRIRQGEIVALIGPNGAGKTTFFNCLTGMYPPHRRRPSVHPSRSNNAAPQWSQAKPDYRAGISAYLPEHPPFQQYDCS